jgi:hypothetical protein
MEDGRLEKVHGRLW